MSTLKENTTIDIDAPEHVAKVSCDKQRITIEQPVVDIRTYFERANVMISRSGAMGAAGDHITSCAINEEQHLILTTRDGKVLDAGFIDITIESFDELQDITNSEDGDALFWDQSEHKFVTRPPELNRMIINPADVTDGTMLVYDESVGMERATNRIDNENTSFDGGEF